MGTYRIMIFGNGCFRSWVLLLLLLPLLPGCKSYFWLGMMVFAFMAIPIYVVAALEEWVFRLVVESAKREGLSRWSMRMRLLLAAFLAPLIFSTVIFFPMTCVLAAPGQGLGNAVGFAGVVAGVITLASLIAMALRSNAVLDDLLDYA